MSLPSLELVTQLLQTGEQWTHGKDRVNSQIGPGPMGGNARSLDLEPDEPLMRDRDIEVGGLDDDRGVGRINRLE
jgi:hypothetical protein